MCCVIFVCFDDIGIYREDILHRCCACWRGKKRMVAGILNDVEFQAELP